jgi:hypothetical protein
VATRREKKLCPRKKPGTNYEPRIPLTPTGLLMEGLYTQNLLPNKQESFSQLTLEIGEFSRNTRKHSTDSVPDSLFQRIEQSYVLAVSLASNDMTVFGCTHRSQNACDVRRMLVSRFNRTNALRDQVVETVVVELACELVPILGTGKLFQCPFSTLLDDETLHECGFVRTHA